MRKDKCKADDVNKHPLYYQIIFRKGKTQLPSGKYVHINHWDLKKRCVKDALLKNILIKEENRIYNVLLEMDNNGEEFTKDSVKNRIKGIVDEKINPDFYYHFDNFFKLKFGIEELSEGTKYHYELFRKQLSEYKPKISLNEINSKFIDDFVYYLKVDKKVGNSGINTRLKCFSAVLNKFVIDKIVSENPCKHVKRPKENKRIVFLNPDELKRVVDADLKLGNLTKGLELTRKLFLFSCYTGLRFSDVMNLKKENIIENKKLVVKMIKTKDTVEVYLNSYSLKILGSADLKSKKSTEFVFKKRENVSVNRDLKIIGKLAKVNKSISFHAARHTFGSILALNNTPTQIIMSSMGHRDIRVTQIYMNSDEATTSKIMKSIKF